MNLMQTEGPVAKIGNEDLDMNIQGIGGNITSHHITTLNIVFHAMTYYLESNNAMYFFYECKILPR